MEEMKLHNKTYWLYTHFFHFFDIPNFLPYELVKKFLKHWNKYFNSRDRLKEEIEAKDNLISNFDLDNISDVIDLIATQKGNCTSILEDYYSTSKSILADIESEENAIISILEEIISDQESYNWKCGAGEKIFMI